MIALLQRQHVRKRAAPPVRMRAGSAGVRWQQTELSVPVGAPQAHGYLGPGSRSAARRDRARHQAGGRPAARVLRRQSARRSLVARIAGARIERARLAAQLAAQKPARGAERQRSALPAGGQAHRAAKGRFLRSGWIALALGAALAALLLVPALRTAALLLPRARPSLPETAEPDALYRSAVPEEPARPATTARPAQLAGLQIVSYRTRKGDSLSLVAQKFRLSLGTVISWNDIRDGRSLAPGVMLRLPNADGLRYRVRRGDTLEGIARSSGVALNGILDWNGLSSAVITVGQELFLPGARLSQADINRVTGSLFIYPVRGRLSSTYGSRADPFTGVVRFHNGVDLVARLGTPVAAAMSGTVVAIGFNANYGRYIFLQHPGYQTMYAHLSRIAVSTGQKVAQGQKIGELGNTGYSTGPHLHFSVYRGSEPVDPLRLLK